MIPTEPATCFICDAPTRVIIGELKPGQQALCLACAFAVDQAMRKVDLIQQEAPDA